MDGGRGRLGNKRTQECYKNKRKHKGDNVRGAGRTGETIIHSPMLD